jgi:FkbM family methyltransferase
MENSNNKQEFFLHGNSCFISYAQNHEDVFLHRIFKDKKDGFYVDVGANDPNEISITKAFYLAGWSGINIEPDPMSFQKLVEHRKRDINLNVGAGENEEELTFFQLKVKTDQEDSTTVLSTFSHEIAERHCKEFNIDKIETKVKIMKLSDIFSQHATGKEIDFMIIDVEGWELSVLKSADFKTFRPKVIVIEATYPTTQISTHQEWEHVLLENQYEYVYFDGLNRWYIPQELSILKEHFKTPINVFDNYRLGELVVLEGKVKELQETIKTLQK